MYHKFIITDDGVLRFGVVYLHRDLLELGEDASNGGGLWQYNPQMQALQLFGRSFDFGGPDFSAIRRVEWSSAHLDGPCPLLFYPHWPSLDPVEPVSV